MLRLGIVGCGRVTNMFHLKAIEEVEEVTLTAVADLDQARMVKVRKKSGAKKGYLDYRELLSDPDVEAVVINTPPRLHEEMVINSLKAGKHVLCEKPLCKSVEGCQHIKQVQDATGLIVLPGHNYTYTPSLEIMKQILEERKSGEMRKIEVRFENNLKSYGSETDFRLREDLGIIEDILPHILPVVQKLAGKVQKIKKIQAWKKKYDVLDNMNILFESKSGVDLDCTLSWTRFIPSFKVEAYCRSGTIETDLMRSPYNVTTKIDGSKKRIGDRSIKLYLDLLRLKHPSFQLQYTHFNKLVNGFEHSKITVDDEVEIIRVIKEVENSFSDPILKSRYLKFN